MRQKSRRAENKEQHNRKSTVVDMPHGDDILRILRMRRGRDVVDFLRREFESRNSCHQPKLDDTDIREPVIPETSSLSIEDTPGSPALPAHGVTLTD